MSKSSIWNHKLFITGFSIILIFITCSFFYTFVLKDFLPLPHNEIYDKNGVVFEKAPFAPSLEFPLGSDKAGNNMLYMVIDGAKYTILISILVGFGRVILGLIFGTALLILPNTAKAVIKGLFDGLHYFPLSLFMYMLTASLFVFSWSFGKLTTLFVPLIVITLLSTPILAVFISDEIQRIKHKEFIINSKLMGGSQFHIFIKHVCPFFLPQLLVVLLQQIGQVLIIFAHLGILGVFIGGNVQNKFGTFSASNEWGGLIANNFPLFMSNPVLVLSPIICLALVVLSLNFMVEGLKEVYLDDNQPVKKAKEKKITKMVYASNLKKVRILLLMIPLMFSILVSSTIQKGTKENLSKVPAVAKTNDEQTISSFFTGDADYVIDLKLDNDNTFHIKAKIDVTNESTESWKDVGFYFIPNAFTKENKPNFMTNAANFNFKKITVNGFEQPFSLSNNLLLIKLYDDLGIGESINLNIEYSLEIPEDGVRLTKIENNYYLAQWYPMLGYYQNGWKIEDFYPFGESYFTGYGDYEIKYEFPREYFVVSSGEDEEIKPSKSGKIVGNDIKDFYLGLLDPKQWQSDTVTVNETNLRVFMPTEQGALLVKTTHTAGEIFSFLEKRIGNTPNTEVDIIGNDGDMEYPNVVEVSKHEDGFERILAHELAHQWFYYLVSNDPYHEAWLDEGITEFTTSLYLMEKYDEEVGLEFANRMVNLNGTDAIANKSLADFETSYNGTVYGMVPTQLWSFFKENGGQDVALQFLSKYYETYQYKIVNSKEFVKFFTEYFGEDHSDFFEWLQIK